MMTTTPRTWKANDPITPEVEFLIENKLIKLNSKNPKSYFNMDVFGRTLYSPKDSILVIHSVDHDNTGKIKDVCFYFTHKNEL